MKFFTMIIFLSLVLGIGFSGMASAGNDTSPSQYCKDNDDMGLDHDTCVICLAQAEPYGLKRPTCICKILEFNGDLEISGYASLGDCISCLRTGQEGCPPPPLQ